MAKSPKISQNFPKFLHMTIFFSTNIICDICDKYELWRQTESDWHWIHITQGAHCPHDLWEQSGLGNQTRHWTAFVIPDNLHWEQTRTFTWFYDKAQNFLIGCWMNFSFVQNFKIIEMRDFFLKPSFCPCLNHIDSTDCHFFLKRWDGFANLSPSPLNVFFLLTSRLLF